MDYLGQLYDEKRALGSVSESAPFAPGDAVAAVEQDRVVMFTDLVGFTKISAATGSRATGALQSRVLTAQLGVIESAGGTVGNIMGDAIMASWTIRVVQMHSGFRVDPESSPRHGIFESINARRAQRRRWNDHLDRLAECLVAA